jgi:hypothetical protein
VATALVVALSSQQSSPGTTAIALVLTNAVFWLAHVHARVVAVSVTAGRRPRAAEVREEMRREWPLLQACVPLLIPLLLGVLGVFSRSTAHWLSILAGLVALLAWGVVIGRRRGMGWAGTALLAGINLALGLIVVLLKVLVDH